jgi:hypothetical protein
MSQKIFSGYSPVSCHVKYNVPDDHAVKFMLIVNLKFPHRLEDDCNGLENLMHFIFNCTRNKHSYCHSTYNYICSIWSPRWCISFIAILCGLCLKKRPKCVVPIYMCFITIYPLLIFNMTHRELFLLLVFGSIRHYVVRYFNNLSNEFIFIITISIITMQAL